MPEGAQSPTSPHTWAPWAAAKRVARAARALRSLLYRLPGVHHTEAANVGPEEATEHEMAGRGGAERGAHPQVWAGRTCFCAGVRPPFAQAPGWGGVPFFAQAPSSARVPAVPEARGDTKGYRENAERGRGSWSGFRSQTTWSGFSARERGSPEPRAWSLPTLPSLPFPFISFPCSNGLAGRIGHTGRRRGSHWEDEDSPSSLPYRNGAAERVSQPVGTRTSAGRPVAPLPSLVLYSSRSPRARRW